MLNINNEKKKNAVKFLHVENGYSILFPPEHGLKKGGVGEGGNLPE